MCTGSNAHSQLLAAAEPDLSTALALLQSARENNDINRYVTLFTAESIELRSTGEALIAAHRLRQNKPKYPLLSIRVNRALYGTQELLSALTASTTLTSFTGDRSLSNFAISTLALPLKSVPTLRAVDHTWFADDAVVKLLQSRTNWTCIHLPTEARTASKVSAFAALNRTDFELHLKAPIEAADFSRWLANPHLTHLHVSKGQIPAACYDALYNCRYLTTLVWTFEMLSHPLLMLLLRSSGVG